VNGYINRGEMGIGDAAVDPPAPVTRGEPGIGKSAILDYAALAAVGAALTAVLAKKSARPEETTVRSE